MNDFWEATKPFIAGFLGGVTAIAFKFARRMKVDWPDVIIVGLIAIPSGWLGLVGSQAVKQFFGIETADGSVTLMVSWVFAYLGPEFFRQPIRNYLHGPSNE